MSTGRAAMPDRDRSSRDIHRRASMNRKTKLQGPFKLLGGDIIVMIITYLLAEGTDILRRVSCRWKHMSERNNEDAAIRRHFGNLTWEKKNITKEGKGQF